MLVGPTFTVEELEEKMNTTFVAYKRDRIRLTKELTELKQQEMAASRYKTVEAAKERQELLIEFLAKEKELKEKDMAIQFIGQKLEELQEVEAYHNGNYDKSKQRLTLTLNECILLGISTATATEASNE